MNLRKELGTLAIIILSVTSFKSAIADWHDVPTGSMLPSIEPGDRIVVNKLAYDIKVPFTTWTIAEWSEPERFDVIVFYDEEGTRLVKRVIGLPGETIELRRNRLFVNGEPAEYSDDAKLKEVLNEQSHLIQIHGNGIKTSFGPILVPERTVFVLGDNRNNSLDSRWFGAVSFQQITGRAEYVAFSRHDLMNWKPERFLLEL